MVGFVVGVKDRAVDTAADPDPLAEGVVEGGFGARAICQRLQTPDVVLNGGAVRDIHFEGEAWLLVFGAPRELFRDRITFKNVVTETETVCTFSVH